MAYRTRTRQITDERRNLRNAEAAYAAAVTLYDTLEDALEGYLNPGPGAPLQAVMAAEQARDTLDRAGNHMYELEVTVEYHRDLLARLEAVAS